MIGQLFASKDSEQISNISEHHWASETLEQSIIVSSARMEGVVFNILALLPGDVDLNVLYGTTDVVLYVEYIKFADPEWVDEDEVESQESKEINGENEFQYSNFKNPCSTGKFQDNDPCAFSILLDEGKGLPVLKLAIFQLVSLTSCITETPKD